MQRSSRMYQLKVLMLMPTKSSDSAKMSMSSMAWASECSPDVTTECLKRANGGRACDYGPYGGLSGADALCCSNTSFGLSLLTKYNSRPDTCFATASRLTFKIIRAQEQLLIQDIAAHLALHEPADDSCIELCGAANCVPERHARSIRGKERLMTAKCRRVRCPSEGALHLALQHFSRKHLMH